MAKTIVQKVGSPDPDVTVFKISGTLGFHENKVLVKFFEECSSRNIRKLVLDLSELDSLGGGCAKIIRGAADEGTIHVCVAGASRTVRNFLAGKGDNGVLFADSLDDALSLLRRGPESTARSEAGAAPAAEEAPARPGLEAPGRFARADRLGQPGRSGPRDRPGKRDRPPAAGLAHANDKREPDHVRDALSEIDVLLRDPTEAERPAAGDGPPSAATADGTRRPGADPAPEEPTRESVLEGKELKRKVLRYRSLFSLNKEFSRIDDKSGLLDAFLLSIMAQVGVESAAFLELSDEQFTAACWKGFETADPKSLSVRRSEVDADAWLRSPEILPIGDAPISDQGRARIEKWDLPFAAPFIVLEKLRGIVLLGRPIRRAFDADAWEFLSIMFDQVAIAYENSCRLEKQSERTLGLVQSLISMIETNTVSKGTTEMVMDLTYAVAVRMHYPEEHLRDLLYGTVLRDIGMLSMANYIVKSPRELVQEEWEVIKQHPAEGSSMLEKMGFSDHTCAIVRSHHERYNGEGYPDGLTGPIIPLGARILSVVESYTAMLHDRPNRPALTADEAFNTLEENWGLRYDPEVVKVFSQVLEENARAGGRARAHGIELIKG